jgi:predicted nucleic acid-binding protein
MASKLFLDANVLLDFTLKRNNYEDSRRLIQMVIDKKYQAYITPSIVHILGYWLTKFYGTAKAKEILLTLLADIQVIDITHETTLTALHSRIADIEDALQYYSAIHHKIDFFISGDQRLKKESLAILPVFSLTEFLSL